MAKVLVLGATGYVGGRLVPSLLQQGHDVRCLVRNVRKASAKPWANQAELFEGDILKRETLSDAFDGAEVVYYLVHSMASSKTEFSEADRIAAMNAVAISEKCGVKRIIYLGGLGKKDSDASAHLRSRHEVGEILRSGNVPVTEFRAAVIVGSGSVSFEIIHHLVNRLPVMICPRWVYTRTQPIAIRDVIQYLVDSLRKPESIGRIIDIGGPEVVTFYDMMMTVARVLGLRRRMFQVPVLTPRLSSYWVNLVTPIPSRVAGALVEGLRYETVCENDNAARMFDIKPIPFEEAVRRALSAVTSHTIKTSWIDAEQDAVESPVDPTHLREDRRELKVNAPAETLYATVSSLGGNNGWYYADWLWKLRGFIDKQLGGVGLRRGRRHPEELFIGDAVDFWRVEDVEPDKRLLLRAEMKVWGRAWLEFKVESLDKARSKLTQRATYYPKGLFGLIYWYAVYVLHAIVFKGLAGSIKSKAEAIQESRLNVAANGEGSPK